MDVPLVTQATKSYDCGPACVAMMLQYYGFDESVDSLKKEIELYDGEWKGSFMPQLGIPFLQRGFSATIVTMDPRFFQLKDSGMSQEKVRERVENKLSSEGATGELAKLMLAFMDAGGEFEVQIPTEQHLSSETAQNRPVLALLTTQFLTADTPGYNQHFNVVTDVQVLAGDAEEAYVEVCVNDPATNDEGYHGGKLKHQMKNFLYGVHACAAEGLDTGCFLLIKK